VRNSTKIAAAVRRAQPEAGDPGRSAGDTDASTAATTAAASSAASTADQILDVAERLVQGRGFNAFSYADIAAELSLTKPALHSHFANKATLGAQLIARYSAHFAHALAVIDATEISPMAKLNGYVGLYRDVLRNERMCLCGMLAAEFETLPIGMRESVLAFFDHNEAWLLRVLSQGVKDGSLDLAGPRRDAARMIMSGLEGAMLVARPYADVGRFEATARILLASVSRDLRRPEGR
jgi:TetR/AcrR family transcriptional repressor of nem operon